MEKREAAVKLGNWLETQEVENATIGDLMEDGYITIDRNEEFAMTTDAQELLKMFNPACYKKLYINPKKGKNRTADGSHVIMRDGHYTWTGGYDTRGVPRQAGFVWDREKKYWWTDDPAIARQLFDFADYDAKVEMGSPIVPEGLGKYKEIILEGVQYLADCCDYAVKLDYMGYSKGDTHLGHSLATKSELTAEQAALCLPLLSIHRYQLPGHIYNPLLPFFAVSMGNKERR